MSDALAVLLRVNLAAAVAVAVVMALRLPARALFGARIAYRLWALVPLAAAAMLAPARVVTVARPAAELVMTAAEPGLSAPLAASLPAAPDLWGLLGAAWMAGGLLALAHLAWRQAQFGRALREGRAGPAAVGVLRPRVVTPDDFALRYTPREQRLVLTHEETHLARNDPRINALVALARCVNWFNPLVHLLSHYLRLDQELACDAQVVAAHPTARRSYAEALLKTQLAARPLPLGCYWPAQAAHPLAARIDLLARHAPMGASRRLGALAVAGVALGGACIAWAARPAEIVIAPATRPAQAQVRPSPAAAPDLAPRHVASLTAPVPATAPPAIAVPQPAAAPAFVADGGGDAQPQAQPEPQPEPQPFSADPAEGRRLPAGLFGPPAKVHAIAAWSSVEPGSAVRVVATMVDPDGIPLTTDLTAFGSQSFYRLGYVLRNSSHYKLFTSVVQEGERLRVTAGLNHRLDPLVSNSIMLASGQTGQITLPNGLVVTVTPTIRAETPQELAESARMLNRAFVRVDRVETR